MRSKQLKEGALLGVVAALLLIFVMMFTQRGVEARGEINVNQNNVAIEGYDTVAYFRAGQAMKGSPEFTARWKGVIWQFASAENRDLFAADPKKYAPQFGGY